MEEKAVRDKIKMRINRIQASGGEYGRPEISSEKIDKNTNVISRR